MNGLSPRFARWMQLPTLLLTYAIKLVGLASAFNQLLLVREPRFLPMAVSAFMMAGAEFSEGLILAALGRMMVVPAPDPPHPTDNGGEKR